MSSSVGPGHTKSLELFDPPPCAELGSMLATDRGRRLGRVHSECARSSRRNAELLLDGRTTDSEPPGYAQPIPIILGLFAAQVRWAIPSPALQGPPPSSAVLGQWRLMEFGGYRAHTWACGQAVMESRCRRVPEDKREGTGVKGEMQIRLSGGYLSTKAG